MVSFLTLPNSQHTVCLSLVTHLSKTLEKFTKFLENLLLRKSVTTCLRIKLWLPGPVRHPSLISKFRFISDISFHIATTSPSLFSLFRTDRFLGLRDAHRVPPNQSFISFLIFVSARRFRAEGGSEWNRWFYVL